MFLPHTRFLIVDDFSTMRKIVKKIVGEDLGYKNLHEAVNGKNAWDLLNAQYTNKPQIDVIISDWNMPELMGIELLRKCREDSRFKNIPFILVTAESDISQIKEAVSLGVSEYMLKPFTPAMFKEKLEKVYRKHNPPQQVIKQE